MSSLTSLYLAPVDPRATPDLRVIRQVLGDLAIIGDKLGPASYAAGTGFSQHVVYAGCSPHLVMQPPQDGGLAFCHVALHGPSARPQLITGASTVPPRCPACRARFSDWRDRLPQWSAGDRTARCSACGKTWPASDLDWRGHAVSGRVLVELRNVFPGEASPSDVLMQHLAEATGLPWRHAWAPYLEPPARDEAENAAG